LGTFPKGSATSPSKSQARELEALKAAMDEEQQGIDALPFFPFLSRFPLGLSKFYCCHGIVSIV